mgnify:CR=1 FL=1
MKKEVLILLHPGFEEIEAVTPIDLLRRAGLVVHTASTSNQLEVQSKGGILLKAERLLSDHEHSLYDALIIPGGPGIFKIRDHNSVQKKIREFHNSEKCIACICAAPLLLLDQGLNETFPMTCHPSVENEFSSLISKSTVSNQHIITSKGAGTAIPFSLAIIEHLLDKDTAQNIADAICF